MWLTGDPPGVRYNRLGQPRGAPLLRVWARRCCWPLNAHGTPHIWPGFQGLWGSAAESRVLGCLGKGTPCQTRSPLSRGAGF